MTPTPARLKLLAGINERLDGCERDGITGELVIRIPFKRGLAGGAWVERKENLSGSKKTVDNFGFLRLSE